MAPKIFSSIVNRSGSLDSSFFSISLLSLTIRIKASNFAFKGYFKNLLRCWKEKDGYLKWFAGNVAFGSVAGATTSLFLYHLDYAQTRLGTNAKECSVNGKRRFKGMIGVYRKTLSSDDIKGLYRVFGVSIVGITLYREMYFGLYDTFKPIVLVGSLEGKFLASFLGLEHYYLCRCHCLPF